MNITAVIPARGGSVRVKNKNIRSFADSSLLEIKIEQLKRINRISKIVVSSDSDLILDIALKHGVFASKRPLEYCDEKSKTFNEVVTYIASEQVDTEDMMWMPCVCPLVADETIEDALNVYQKIINGNVDKDSVVSSVLFKEYIFDTNGPINFSVEHHVKSQDLPNWHYICNGFFIAKANKMSEWGFVYGPNPYLYEISKYEAIDIDDDVDFGLAEYLYLSKQRKCKDV